MVLLAGDKGDQAMIKKWNRIKYLVLACSALPTSYCLGIGIGWITEGNLCKGILSVVFTVIGTTCLITFLWKEQK
jgi:hypothetical protein